MPPPPRQKLAGPFLLLLFAWLIPTTPAPAREFKDIVELNQAIASSDTPPVEAITLAADAIDRKVSLLDSPDRAPDFSEREIAQFIRLAGQAQYSPDPEIQRQRHEARTAAIKKLGFDQAPQTQVIAINSQLLFLAAGLLGMDIDQPAALRILADPQIANNLRLVAAEALLAQKTLTPEAEPIFTVIAQDPWSIIITNCLSQRTPLKSYPLREKAYEALKRLGVPCELTSKPGTQPDPEWKTTFPETIVTIKSNPPSTN